jgi:isoprenylcysteine carboxyl methyltransferase (ICMT) family protein YpbQ
MRAVPELGVAITILSFVTAQRLVELVYARGNEVRNYAIATAEILVPPMAFGVYAYGVAFTLANAGILAIRIQAEKQALQSAAGPSTELSRKA